MNKDETKFAPTTDDGTSKADKTPEVVAHEYNDEDFPVLGQDKGN